MAAQSWHTTRRSELWRLNQKEGRGCAWWEPGRPLAGNLIAVCLYLHGLALSMESLCVCSSCCCIWTSGSKGKCELVSPVRPSVPCMLLVSPSLPGWLARTAAEMVTVSRFFFFPAPLLPVACPFDCVTVDPPQKPLAFPRPDNWKAALWSSREVIGDCLIGPPQWYIQIHRLYIRIVYPFLSSDTRLYAFIFSYSIIFSPDLYNYMYLSWIR
jgi:hypothetical protein